MEKRGIDAMTELYVRFHKEAETDPALEDEGRAWFKKIEDNDPEAMEAKLRELVADPERVHRVGVQASKSIVRSWEDCVGEALDRYNVLLKIRNLPTIERIS